MSPKTLRLKKTAVGLSRLVGFLRMKFAVAAPCGVFLVWTTLGAVLPESSYDVVIYGGTSSGCMAAVQAAKMGKSVVLIEPGKHLGGLTGGGLGLVDAGNTDSVGGLAHEFFHRVWQHYENDKAWKWENRHALRGQHAPLRSDAQTMWVMEPSVAEQIFKDMVVAAGAKVEFGQRLERKKGVHKEGQRILSITMESGRTFAGKMFIDATYEGDLMATAGVSYFVGREANSRYGETMNGIRPMPERATAWRIDPYRVKGKPDSGLLPRVHPGLEGKPFEEDRGVQAYCYRMCLTDVPENRIMVQKPANYDELEYELVFRYIEKGAKPDSFFKLSMLPNRKTDSNNSGSFSTDYIGMSWAWAEADYATRERIASEHEKWQRGLIWTLQNHPRVPPEIRKYYAPWGLPQDEFTDNGNWSPQLYVREARRMVSDLIIAEDMALGLKPPPEDSVGLGSYAFDSHAIKYYVDEASGFVTIDGALIRPPRSPRPPHPYPISYRAMIPKRGECENLLVPVCLSATHVTYGSIRMEPVFMILGQSAATAAALAIDRGTTLQDLPYELLKSRLLADNQVITWSKPKAAAVKPDDLRTDLQVLLDRQVITSTDYWQQHAVTGGRCDGARVSDLLIKAAGKFQPATTVEQAIAILKQQRVVTSPAYWQKNTHANGVLGGANVAQLINSLTHKLAATKASAPILTSSEVILARATPARPLKGGVVPADIARRLGSAHVSGRYHFTDKPFLLEGAERLNAMGFGGIKLWFTSIERAYRFNSQWNLPSTYTFKELAEHPYFKAAFDLPFSVIALEIYPASLRDTTGAGQNMIDFNSDFAADEQQMYELAAYLLRKYRERDLTFLLQNWEGDWMFRGSARNEWQRGEYPELERRSLAFQRWFAARQHGVERARAEVTDSRCKVFHAVEVNRVYDSLKNIPTLTTHVLPHIRPDFVAWSCYDGLKPEAKSADKTAVAIWQGLDLIQHYAHTTQQDFEGKPAVYVGEIGFPEELVASPAAVEMMDGALGTLFARRVPYILHWELFCNERKDGRRDLVPVSDKAEDLRGFWLVRPDGSLSYTGEYFQQLLAKAGQRMK